MKQIFYSSPEITVLAAETEAGFALSDNEVRLPDADWGTEEEW